MAEKADVIIQARVDSTRLPGKVLMDIEGIPLIRHIVLRLECSSLVRRIIVATTEDSLPGIKAALDGCGHVSIFTGSKENVLERYYLAAKEHGSRTVVRATGDNPLVCPDYLDRAIALHETENADLTHYLGIPLGTGVEVISMKALKQSYECAQSAYDREHVTPFIYKNRDSYKVLEPMATGAHYTPDLRVTVDTAEDMARVRSLFHHYRGRDFISMDDVVAFFADRQENEKSARHSAVEGA